MELLQKDLIFAPATPEGESALAVVRVSGKGAKSLFSEIFFEGKEFKPRYAYFKALKKDSEFIDEVVCTYFAEGASYTGEESFELTCHGSPLVLSEIFSFFRFKGLRLAEPGEFSFRAYLNGKIDLAKAEGVQSLIHSKTEISKDLSLSLLDGSFKKKILSLKDQLLFILSRLEALIDFSDQDIDLDFEEEIKKKMEELDQEFSKSLSSYSVGQFQHKGIKVALVGPPNSGKSTLFNGLLGFERSIVSEIKGTTRDYLSELCSLSGSSFELIDTAGLRESEDQIESLGIQKSVELSKKAQLILLLVSKDTKEEALKFYEGLAGSSNLILLKSKIDQGDFELPALLQDQDFIKFSSQSEEDMESLKACILERLKPYLEQPASLFIQRHYDLMSLSQQHLKEAMELESLSGFEDVVSSFLYRSLEALDEILYIDRPEEVRDKIFSDFCLGK